MQPRISVKALLGVDVTVGALLGAHQVELTSCCTLVGGVPGTGTAVDNRQIGAEWVELAKLGRVRFSPKRLADVIVAHGAAPFG